MSAAANFKYNIEVVSIKGENLRNAEFMSKNVRILQWLKNNNFFLIRNHISFSKLDKKRFTQLQLRKVNCNSEFSNCMK